jgi:hypothetical protein
MIVYRYWYRDIRPRGRVTNERREKWDGWFLFGVIPVFMRLLSLNA